VFPQIFLLHKVVRDAKMVEKHCSTVIALSNFIQYSHCQAVQLFRLTPVLMKAFTTIIPKHIFCPCGRFSD